MKPMLTALLLTALLLPSPVHAQAIDRADLERELRSMVVEPVDADRRVLRHFLHRDEVQQLAEDRGVDLDRLERRVATMDGDQASELAQRVQDLQDELEQVGGDTFVITSSTIVIILLVLILIAVI